jgi:hypothetical protein
MMLNEYFKCQNCDYVSELRNMNKRSHGGWDCPHCFGNLEKCEYHFLLAELANKSLSNVEIKLLKKELEKIIKKRQSNCDHDFKSENDGSMLDSYRCVKCDVTDIS